MTLLKACGNNMPKIINSISYQSLSTEVNSKFFAIAKRASKNILPYLPNVAITDILLKYKTYAIVHDSIVVIDFNSADIHNEFKFFQKYYYGLHLKYITDLRFAPIQPTTEITKNILSAYYTIVFRVLSDHILYNQLDNIKASMLYALTGVLLSRIFYPIDLSFIYRNTKQKFSVIHSDIRNLPDMIDFDTFFEYLNEYGITLYKVTMNEFNKAIQKFLGYGAILFVKNICYFLSYIMMMNIKSNIINVSFRKYNPVVFNKLINIINKFYLQYLKE